MARIIQGFGRIGRCTLRAALKEQTFAPVKPLPDQA